MPTLGFYDRRFTGAIRLLDGRAVLASYLWEAEEAAIRNLICHEG